MSGVWIECEKLEACPCCDKALDQTEYDFQWCRSCQLKAGRTQKQIAERERFDANAHKIIEKETGQQRGRRPRSANR